MKAAGRGYLRRPVPEGFAEAGGWGVFVLPPPPPPSFLRAFARPFRAALSVQREEGGKEVIPGRCHARIHTRESVTLGDLVHMIPTCVRS